MKSVWEM